MTRRYVAVGVATALAVAATTAAALTSTAEGKPAAAKITNLKAAASKTFASIQSGRLTQT